MQIKDYLSKIFRVLNYHDPSHALEQPNSWKRIAVVHGLLTGCSVKAGAKV